MKIVLKRNAHLILLGIFVQVQIQSILCDSIHNYGDRSFETVLGDISTSRILNPLIQGINGGGILTRANRMLSRGVRLFREGLKEGVKVAQMLKEDVDEGVESLLLNNNSKNNPSNRRHNRKQMHPDDEVEIDDEIPAGQKYQQILREGMLGGILKFMNIDSKRIGIIALNVLIFFAEMITSQLIGKDSHNNNSIDGARSFNFKDSVMSWAVNGYNDKVDKFLQDVRNESLPENLIQSLSSVSYGSTDTSCVQLFICKMSPFINGVQKTLDQVVHLNSRSTNNTNSSSSTAGGKRSFGGIPSVLNILSKVIPTKEILITYGDDCEKRFTNCQLLKIPREIQT